jgi:hypothetical protein
MVTVLSQAEVAEHVGRDPVILQVLDHATTARGTKALPALTDIDLFSLPQAVPNMFTISVSPPPHRFVYKFSGSQCDAIMGRNPMGRYLDEMYPRPGHKVVLSYHELIVQRRPQIFRALFSRDDTSPRTMLRLTIPLSTDGERIDNVVGAIVIHRDDSYAEMPAPSRPAVIDIRYLDWS